MGVPAIWDILKPYLKNNRVPLSRFVSEFHSANGIYPRIAIDGYTWLFECGFIVRVTDPASPSKTNSYIINGKAMTNFVYRLKELLALNIELIFVFDGYLKPAFKNRYNKTTNDRELLDAFYSDILKFNTDFKSEYLEHVEFHNNFERCFNINFGNEPMFLKPIEQLLDILHIPYILACGEGEAQCAWLNVNKYVHFVLANDSDTLMFGCNNMLRNFSKFWEDRGAAATSGININSPEKPNDTKEYFVTVIDMNDIQNRSSNNIDKWSLLLFAALLGADYNEGVKGLGRVKAEKIAFSKSPNFSELFKNIFNDINRDRVFREMQYETFKKYLANYCQMHSKELFGRNYKNLLGEETFDTWPNELAVLFYFHPFINHMIDKSILPLNKMELENNKIFETINFNRLYYLLKEEITGVANFEKWFHITCHEAYLLKYILSHNKPKSKIVKITEEKITKVGQNNEKIMLWKVRFNTFLEGVDTPNDLIESPTRSRSPSKRQIDIDEFKFSTWISQDSIPKEHHLVQEFRKRESLLKIELMKKPKRVSRKKKPYQKNNLDDFLSKHASPIKSDVPIRPKTLSRQSSMTLKPSPLSRESSNLSDDASRIDMLFNSNNIPNLNKIPSLNRELSISAKIPNLSKETSFLKPTTSQSVKRQLFVENNEISDDEDAVVYQNGDDSLIFMDEPDPKIKAEHSNTAHISPMKREIDYNSDMHSILGNDIQSKKTKLGISKTLSSLSNEITMDSPLVKLEDPVTPKTAENSPIKDTLATDENIQKAPYGKEGISQDRIILQKPLIFNARRQEINRPPVTLTRGDSILDSLAKEAEMFYKENDDDSSDFSSSDIDGLG